MSCLSLKLPMAGKVWRNLTNKLQSKLHRLQPKPMKKNRNRLRKATGGVVSRSLFTKQRNKRLARSYQLRKEFFEMKTAPVFVDKLFKEHVMAEQCSQPRVTDSPPPAKSTKLLDQQAAVPEEGENNLSGDDMWESLALASPLLREVNERAEEFIVRFRAEMVVQEMLARSL